MVDGYKQAEDVIIDSSVKAYQTTPLDHSEDKNHVLTDICE